MQVMTDVHAPDEFRAFTVRNLDAWYAAFEVQPGEKLYLAPGDRCGSGSATESDRDFDWVLGVRGCSRPLGWRHQCRAQTMILATKMTTATPIIKTTRADNVQERRSESSRLWHGGIVGLRWMPALRPGSQFPADRLRRTRPPYSCPAALDRRKSPPLDRPPAQTGWLNRVGCLDRLLSQEVHGRRDYKLARKLKRSLASVSMLANAISTPPTTG